MEAEDLKEAKFVKESKSAVNSSRWLGILLVLAGIFIVSGYLFLRERQSLSPMNNDRQATTEDPNNSQPLLSGPNAIYVADHAPGPVITISNVILEESGYVVIHVDDGGSPGEIVANSDLLEKGSHENIKLPLSFDTQDGETYYAMLYIDNGDGEFNFPDGDEPVYDDQGNIIMMQFSIDEAQSDEQEEIQI